MLLLLLVMLLATLTILAVAGLVVAYVAYPHQGKEIPRAEWLTDAMNRAVDRWGVPTEPRDDEDAERRQQHVDSGASSR
ncbi:MAG: hypothetical protein ACRDOY_09725 [Nocardioidaceae bacterium]